MTDDKPEPKYKREIPPQLIESEVAAWDSYMATALTNRKAGSEDWSALVADEAIQLRRLRTMQIDRKAHCIEPHNERYAIADHHVRNGHSPDCAANMTLGGSCGCEMLMEEGPHD